MKSRQLGSEHLYTAVLSFWATLNCHKTSYSLCRSALQTTSMDEWILLILKFYGLSTIIPGDLMNLGWGEI